MTQQDKKQSDKKQSDETRNQFAAGMRKSKSAGSSPGGRPGGSIAGQRPLKDDPTGYATGGLRWPD